MKDVVSKNLKENKGKVFTKKNKKDYNKFKVKPLISKVLIKFTDISRLNSCNRCIYEREGLYMKETKEIFKELKKELTFKERIITKIFKKTFIKIYRLGMIRCFNYYNK